LGDQLPLQKWKLYKLNISFNIVRFVIIFRIEFYKNGRQLVDRLFA